MKKAMNGGNYVQTVNVDNELINFSVQNQKLFDIATKSVSNCNIVNNDLIIELTNEDNKHTDDMLSGIRLYAHTGNEDDKYLERIYKSIKDNIKEDESGDPNICSFMDIPFVVPRGKYNTNFTEKTIKLHGASYNYTIGMKNILKAFWLELPEKSIGYFVIGFDKPLIQGQTDYKFVVIQFKTEDELEIEMEPRYDEVPKINEKIERQISGKYHEVFTQVFKVFVGINVVAPSEFKNSRGDSSLVCSVGSKQGYLFLLNKSLMFVLKPIIYLKFDEIARVEFHRVTSGHSARGFDIEVITKSGVSYLFSGIDKTESDLVMGFFTKNKINCSTKKEEEIKDNEYEDEDDEDDDENGNIESDDEDEEEGDNDFIAKDGEDDSRGGERQTAPPLQELREADAPDDG